MRERSGGVPVCRAMSSTHSSTSDNMPSARKSILMKRASSQESLSHWQTTRSSIAARSSGTSSMSGRDEMIMPPGCRATCRSIPVDLVRQLAQLFPERRVFAAAESRQVIHFVVQLVRAAIGELGDQFDNLPGFRGRKDAPLWKE